MNSNSRWMPETIALVVASLMIAGLEPAAFAITADELPRSEGNVAASTPSTTLPDRPAMMTNAVAQAIPPSQSPRAAVPTTRSPYIPPKKQTNGKSSKKWLWIVLAAAGAGVTTAILVGGGDDSDDLDSIPTVVVGVPSVGQPQ
jgi:hypothetical protein